ncbi:hypothetical protein UPYG_G00171870 [Umbra pygmaea]|uniref:Dynamin-type G domain-containing protein n=1 Tax=Umbra pygmaea TaxID=75934 RepID=A0ABD0WPN2_UMBPY
MNNTLNQHFEEKVRPCIDLIDSLRSLGVEKDLALPAIAVIGDQSSGKSSVLEALSGVAFPRGSGIVTRCPLELKMKRKREGEEWQGKISYQDHEEEIEDASDVEEKIREAQDHMAGPGVGICDDLISLEIGSPDVPDLTLIDLPGIISGTLYDEGLATIPKLAEKLTLELVHHIEKSLPHLEEQIEAKLAETNAQLERCGTGPPEDTAERFFFLIDKVTAFTQDAINLSTGEELKSAVHLNIFATLRTEFGKWKLNLDYSGENCEFTKIMNAPIKNLP